MEDRMTDVLIIGGGLAGLCAAITAREAGVTNVALLCKSVAGKSGNTLVSGSALCVYNPDNRYADTGEAFFEDIIKSGAGMCEPSVVKQFVDESERVLGFLSEHGVKFRYANGAQVVKQPPGHSRRRSYPSDFRSVSYYNRGLALAEPLADCALRIGVDVLNCTDVLELLRSEDGRVCGVSCVSGDASFRISAKAVVLAAGGGARLFQKTNNTSDVSCDSFRLALDAGARLRDMEFVQFFPCMMHEPSHISISTPLFGDGARMVNALGQPFLESYSPAGDKATRDIMARAAKAEIDAGRGNPQYVYVDCTQMNPALIDSQYTEFAQEMLRSGIDIKRDLIPVAPAAHFYIGGVQVNADYSSCVPGLFVCGEAAGGLHGANRLSGNALAETVVSGRVAGVAAARFSSAVNAPLSAAFAPMYSVGDNGKPFDYNAALAELRRVMWREASLTRTRDGLLRARAAIENLEDDFSAAGCPSISKLRAKYDMRSYITTASLLVKTALLREESRGAHFRDDYPLTDDRYKGSFFCQSAGTGVSITFERTDSAEPLPGK